MNSESTFKEQLGTIVSNEQSNWEEKANKNWLLKSAAISLRISKILMEKNMTQKELSRRLGSSGQHVNKIINGQGNFTLKSISKIEACLDTELISVSDN